ncbi:cytochrome c oxidase assembly protein COX18, mitochondrial [Sitodiplosis mosellana]|uniref:cytochrome c oxidase assembly protein COX18, mitochondrial n=1 Tax=Sitodiplosis mosellana TaxID=263140 RepID=UPI002443FE8C|nr:cytochrome c oxidase assembly protein COX18, mitochondrial [Sitodiplosis mosellana]
MNFLPRLPRLLYHIHQYRVKNVNAIASSAAYSICCTQRSGIFERQRSVSAVSVCYLPKRHKSFTESVSEIYLSISSSTTVSYFQNALLSFHDQTGLPWWATIIIYTVGLRMVTFPLAVYGQKIKARLLSILQTELPAMNNELKREVAIAKKKFGLSDKDAYILYKRSFNTQYRKLIERDNCHPLKTTVLFWFQIPIWICHSIGIRNILSMRPDPNSYRALIAYTQMTVGGFLWIPNLIETDTSYILPVLWCITNLVNIELGALEKGGTPSKFMIVMTNVFRGITIAIVPIAASVPSCLTLYWCTSSMCALAQNLILLSPKAKRTFGIPLNTQYHMDHPYRTMANRFSERMEQRKNWCLSFIKAK